jgi:hydroxymethylbilane synthase
MTTQHQIIPNIPSIPLNANQEKHFVIGSRKSQLALIQTHYIRDLLLKQGNVTLEVEGMSTTGDVQLDRALSAMGSKSLFTKELEVALEDKIVDFVVHSLKDLPTTLPPGMLLAATTIREDPRDAVIMSIRNKGMKLVDLPPGSVIGTSSVRRMAQLKAKFPSLEFQDVVRSSQMGY